MRLALRCQADGHDWVRHHGVKDPAAVERAFASQMRRAVTPPVAVAFDTLAIAGKQIVVAEVQGLSAHQRPCETGGRTYLRQAHEPLSASLMTPLSGMSLIAVGEGG